MHKEDFCQALGYGHEKKYQEHGGPSFAQCYRVVQEASSEPAIDVQHLLRWQIFNVLAGNSDGHAKNLSLLHLPGGATRLAPFYDLVCTRAIERFDYHLALDVGGERNPSAIVPAHWESLAKRCDVRPRFLHNMLRETANALQENVGPERQVFEARYGAYPALQRVGKCPAKYILPLPRRNSDDAFQSGKRGAGSWDGGSAVGTSGKGWWRVGRVAA